MIEYYISKILKKLRGVSIKNSHIHRTSKVESGSLIVDTLMEKYSFCGYDCEIVNCEIGAFVSISSNVKIGGGMHPTDWVGMSPVFYEGSDSVKAKFSEHKRKPNLKTIIGNDVWIGANVLIKQGVNVGTGAVIGMGAVVTKDVEPYSIVGGNPARIIRYRFDENIVKRLLDSKWWKYSDKELKVFAIYFKEPEKFLKIIES